MITKYCKCGAKYSYSVTPPAKCPACDASLLKTVQATASTAPSILKSVDHIPRDSYETSNQRVYTQQEVNAMLNAQGIAKSPQAGPDEEDNGDDGEDGIITRASYEVQVNAKLLAAGVTADDFGVSVMAPKPLKFTDLAKAIIPEAPKKARKTSKGKK